MQLNLRNLTSIVAFAASGLAFAQSSGTAFVVAPGLLVTNHHVVDDCGSIEVVASDGRRPATIVDSVQIIDLAVENRLKLTQSFHLKLTHPVTA